MRKGGQNMRRLDMLKAREILRLKHDLGLSLLKKSAIRAIVGG
jgi:hypothetical protein